MSPLLFMGLALLALVLGCETPPPPQPNIVLVSIDSLRSDHLGVYGYERDTSPVIDGLAAEGVRFADAVSPTSWTLPSHLTMLSSLPPEAIQGGLPMSGISPDALTLPEVLQAGGYATAGIVSGPFLGRGYGFGQGFDRYDDRTIIRKGPISASHTGITSPTLVQLTKSWLEKWDEKGRTKPFFLFLHMWDVHYDFAPPPPYDTMFDPDYEGEVDGRNFDSNRAIHRNMDPRDLAHVVSLYDGEIRFTDLHLGRITDELRRLGVYDDTILVLTADHGEEFFEHGMAGHAKHLHEEVIRVPLIIRYPRRIAAGQVVDRQVRLQDIGSTILGLADVPAPAGYGLREPADAASQDLSPWLTGKAAPDTFPTTIAFGENRLAGTAQISVRVDGRKVFGNGVGKKRTWHAYDLRADPNENRDLAKDGLPPDYRPLRRRAGVWERRWSEGRGRLSTKPKVDAEHLERLRALGYIE